MPDHAPTLVHFIVDFDDTTGPAFACRADVGTGNSGTGRVTCFACRQSAAFKQALEVPPIRLSGVMAAAPEIQALDRAALREIAKRGLNAGRGDAEWEALVEIGQALGLTYDDETNRYS